MRIVFVSPYYAPEYKFGGPIRKLEGLAKELVKRGHEVAVATFHSHRRTANESSTREGVHVRYLSWFGRGQRQFPTSTSLLKSIVANAEVVHCFGLYNLICPVAIFYAARARIPFFVEPMGMFVPRMRSVAAKTVYNATLTRRMFRRAAGVVATSELEAKEIKASGIMAKVVVRRNGIDVPQQATAATVEEFRRVRAIASHERLIGYLGRISSKKQLIELVDAFSAAGIRGTKLLIAGPVSEPGYHRHLIERINGSPRRADIVVADSFYEDAYPTALAALDLFVLPSKNENFGNAAGEAAVMGIPVLLTRDCGIAPMIDGKFGLAVEQGVENLRRGMEEMLTSENRGRWSNPELARKELSWDEPVAQIEEIYREAIKQNAEKLRC